MAQQKNGAVFKTLSGRLHELMEWDFVLRFALWLGGLCCLHLFWMGLIDPRGRVYSAFAEHYLNYLAGLRSAVLQVSTAFARALGAACSIASRSVLRTAEGRTLFVDESCLGYGLLAFWTAFTLAQQSAWRTKLLWWVGGAVLIWGANCLRIAVLLLALHRHWAVNRYMDHHTLFNLVVYSLILLLIYAYYRHSERGQSRAGEKALARQEPQPAPIKR